MTLVVKVGPFLSTPFSEDKIIQMWPPDGGEAEAHTSLPPNIKISESSKPMPTFVLANTPHEELKFWIGDIQKAIGEDPAQAPNSGPAYVEADQ
jgi:hypothetical protein